jgi:RNA polymerase sigma factor (sigma-70 family)
MFYEAHFDDAYRLARRATGRDEAFCLDVVQDTMLKVINSIPVLETERSLRSWLARTVHSVAIDRLRADARRTARERGRHDAEPEPSDERHAQVEWLRASLAELDDDDRAMLAQRYAHDRTLRAIGLDFGISEHAAHGRIRRAVARLADAAKGVLP